MQPKTNEPDELVRRTREDLLEEIQRLRGELHNQREESKAAAERRKQLGLFSTRVGIRVVAGSQFYRVTLDLWDAWSAWMRSGRTLPWPELPTRDFAAAFLARFTRTGLVIVALAALPFVLTLVQLVVLGRQNRLIDQQAELSEAARRSSLVFEQSAILDEIDEELDALSHEQRADSTRPRLSQRLEGRIIAFSQALRPYRYRMDDTLTSVARSPERGQLLLALANSGIDFASLRHRASLEMADLSGTAIEAFDFSSTGHDAGPASVVSLVGTDFRGARLHSGSFQGAVLAAAEFQNANIVGVDLRDADLQHADFSHSLLISVDLSRTNLDGAVFQGAHFHGVTLSLAPAEGIDTLQSYRSVAAQLCSAHIMGKVKMSSTLLNQMKRERGCSNKLGLSENVIRI